jgi:hypothetical protein
MNDESNDDENANQHCCQMTDVPEAISGSGSLCRDRKGRKVEN